MGIPLASALLGNEGVFYATAFLTIFFCFAWTHGIMLLTGQHDRRALLKKFCSPTMIGIAIGLVLFFCRIQLPGILQTTFDYVAGLNTPMAMVASGISVAQANLLQAVRTPRVYYVSAVKLLGIPLLLTLLFRCRCGGFGVFFGLRFGLGNVQAFHTAPVGIGFDLGGRCLREDVLLHGVGLRERTGSNDSILRGAIIGCQRGRCHPGESKSGRGERSNHGTMLNMLHRILSLQHPSYKKRARSSVGKLSSEYTGNRPRS